MRRLAFVGVVLLLFHPLTMDAQSLQLADQRRAAGDHAGALRAYMEAVDADPSVASLERLRRYAGAENLIFTTREAAERHDRQRKEAKEPHIAALRQYLKLHPDNRDALVDLVFVLPDDERRALIACAMETPLMETPLRERTTLEREPAMQTSARPYRVGGDVKAPIVVSRVDPVYPEEAKKARISGIVILEALIDASGRVTQTKVLKSLPSGLDAAAEHAVRQWTFRPGTLNGQPVAVWFLLTMNMRAPAE